MPMPFALRRPWLLMRGARVDRGRPDLARLAAIDDPDDFVWAILPHAARTFATSILMLPAPKARVAAVAYLYCRMLDTCEDLAADPEAALRSFAARMTTLAAPPQLPDSAAVDDRDRAHRLLLRRCELVDRVFARLSSRDRSRVVALVETMADGMIWSARRFAEQGGVLVDDSQVGRYCRHVIGEPAVFALELVIGDRVTQAHRDDALAASEMIQLANITRDVERDLARGIGYHPSLRPHLGSRDAAEPVRQARRHLMALALGRLPPYTRLTRSLATARFSLARASAILMLLHTDRHYASMARLVGGAGWRGPDRPSAIVLSATLAAVSRRWSERVMRRVERDFAAAR